MSQTLEQLGFAPYILEEMVERAEGHRRIVVGEGNLYEELGKSEGIENIIKQM